MHHTFRYLVITLRKLSSIMIINNRQILTSSCSILMGIPKWYQIYGTTLTIIILYVYLKFATEVCAMEVCLTQNLYYLKLPDCYKPAGWRAQSFKKCWFFLLQIHVISQTLTQFIKSFFQTYWKFSKLIWPYI